jgi:cytochrome c-type biogenesis protein CcmH/NrfG
MLFRRHMAADTPRAVGVGASETKAPEKPQRRRKGWFEQRRERRKKRRLFEEIVAWIVVPALIYGVYLGYQAVGGLPPAAFDFLSEASSLVLRGSK